MSEEVRISRDEITRSDFRLLLDDSVCHDAICWNIGEKFIVEFKDYCKFQEINKYDLTKCREIAVINIVRQPDLRKALYRIRIEHNLCNNQTIFVVELPVIENLSQKNLRMGNVPTISAYFEEISRNIHEKINEKVKEDINREDQITNGPVIDIGIYRQKHRIKLMIYRSVIPNFSEGVYHQEISKIIDAIDDAVKSLINPLDYADMVSVYFDLPYDKKEIYVQYLVYFTQFLKDLGIEAISQIKEENGRTKFSIVPEDGETALKDVRDALAIYLNLPDERNTIALNIRSNYSDLAVIQLLENISHLKSQLNYANIKIDFLEERLEKHKLSIKISTDLIKKDSNLPYYQKSVVEKPKNEEVLFGGLLKVQEYEGKGFKVDLPQLLRMLKRIFPK